MLKVATCMFEKTIILKTMDMCAALENSSYYQCVRWRRKPRWLPVAKSKVFRIPERFHTPEEERIELTRLKSCYNTQVKSVRLYLRLELERTTATSDIAHVQAKQEVEEHALCKKLNEDWNIEVATRREERLSLEAKAQREIILQKIIDHEQQEIEKLQKIEQLVREEKAKVNSYITADNIDDAIESAIANEVDYNFSIDLKGNIFQGCNTKPLQQEENLQVSVKSS